MQDTVTVNKGWDETQTQSFGGFHPSWSNVKREQPRFSFFHSFLKFSPSKVLKEANLCGISSYFHLVFLKLKFRENLKFPFKKLSSKYLVVLIELLSSVKWFGMIFSTINSRISFGFILDVRLAKRVSIEILISKLRANKRGFYSKLQIEASVDSLLWLNAKLCRFHLICYSYEFSHVIWELIYVNGLIRWWLMIGSVIFVCLWSNEWWGNMVPTNCRVWKVWM